MWSLATAYVCFIQAHKTVNLCKEYKLQNSLAEEVRERQSNKCANKGIATQLN